MLWIEAATLKTFLPQVCRGVVIFFGIEIQNVHKEKNELSHQILVFTTSHRGRGLRSVAI